MSHVSAQRLRREHPAARQEQPRLPAFLVDHRQDHIPALREVRKCRQSARPERWIKRSLVQQADGVIPAFQKNLRASSKLMMTWPELFSTVPHCETVRVA